MAEHSYAWYTIGSEQIWPRIGGADDDPDWFYWTFGFEYDGDSYAVYERAEKVYDLDNQLYGQFCNCKDFLRQEPVQAESRVHLKTLLEGRKANGIIFTTMQKFEDEPGKADRKSVV